MKSVCRLLMFVLVAAASAAWAAESGPNPPQVGQRVHDFALPSLDGRWVKLSDLASQGPVVLVVLRGFPGYQCPVCNTQVQELLRAADDLRAAGAQVALVYPGPSDGLVARAAEFARGKQIPEHYHLLLDANYRMVEQYGLRWNAKNETAYPATFVVDGQATVRFVQVSTTHGGRAKTSDVLAALRSIR